MVMPEYYRSEYYNLDEGMARGLLKRDQRTNMKDIP